MLEWQRRLANQKALMWEPPVLGLIGLNQKPLVKLVDFYLYDVYVTILLEIMMDCRMINMSKNTKYLIIYNLFRIIIDIFKLSDDSVTIVSLYNNFLYFVIVFFSLRGGVFIMNKYEIVAFCLEWYQL